jgi:hypothetical protein
MTAPTWLWVDLHQSRSWPWLHSVSTSDSLAKREDYLLARLSSPYQTASNEVYIATGLKKTA